MIDTKKTIRGSLLVALGALVLVPACRDDKALGTERDREPVVDEPMRPREAPIVNDMERGADRLGNEVEQGAKEVEKDLETPLAEVTGSLGSAVDSIAQAQCGYAQRCGKIGAGKDHASREACMSKVKNDLRDDLNADECKGGAVQKEVDECLAEIKERQCGDPFDAISKLAACRTSDICKALR